MTCSMKRWQIQHQRPQGRLEGELLLISLLEARGVTDKLEVEAFLNPRLRNLHDPLRLPDIRKAVERVQAALRANEQILIYCDYDVDGMTSGALMHRFLGGIGGRVETFIPDRVGEGYGLTPEGIGRALSLCRPDLLIALDCGTTSLEEIRMLNAKGIDVIVIDHHELLPELPAAHAVVNPQRGERDHYLATVGLVFKFCHAFLKVQDDPELFNLRDHLDLVALGTVADLVPLEEDNRILVKQGLAEMNQTSHVGLQELMRRAGVRTSATPVTCGFILGPRLNASGRLASARSGWQLLTTQDRRMASRIAEELEQLNRQRQRLEQQVMDEALVWLNEHFDPERDRCIVVASREWHPGVVGIVASRLARKYYLPSVVISIDENGMGKGSCRSVEGVSLMDGLRSCPDFLEGFGGHAMAAGLVVEEGRVGEFRETFNEWLLREASPEVFVPLVKVDYELDGSDLDDSLAVDLQRLEPYGRHNPPPVFAVSGVEILGKPHVIAGKHLRFKARAGGNEFSVVGFNFADQQPPSSTISIAGHWEIDSYTNAACMRMVDWR